MTPPPTARITVPRSALHWISASYTRPTVVAFLKRSPSGTRIGARFGRGLADRAAVQIPHDRARHDDAARTEPGLVEQLRQRRERARTDDDGIGARPRRRPRLEWAACASYSNSPSCPRLHPSTRTTRGGARSVATDFLVVGSGIAGLRAAADLAAHGRVTILTKADPAESNTGYAQGGIAAAVGPDDSPARAFRRHDGGRRWPVRRGGGARARRGRRGLRARADRLGRGVRSRSHRAAGARPGRRAPRAARAAREGRDRARDRAAAVVARVGDIRACAC